MLKRKRIGGIGLCTMHEEFRACGFVWDREEKNDDGISVVSIIQVGLRSCEWAKRRMKDITCTGCNPNFLSHKIKNDQDLTQCVLIKVNYL